MQTDIENKQFKRRMVEKKRLACPHCGHGITFAKVTKFYTAAIGSMTPGRQMTSEQARDMARVRWDRVKAQVQA